MADLVSGPVVVLDGADCLHLAPALARYLEERARRDGGVPPRLKGIAEKVLVAAREHRDLVLAGSGIGTDRFRDDPAGASCASSVTWLTVEQAAELLGISTGFVRRLCRERALTSVRSGGKGAWRVDESSVLERLGERRMEAA